MKENNNIGVGFGVMVLKDGKILLGQRNSDPAKADSELHGEGTWTMPGGKMRFHESFEDCCYRETLEETGLEIDKSKIKIISVANDMVFDAHFITVGFLCEDFTGEVKVMEPDEIIRWDWFPINELPKPLYFPSEKVVKNYLAGLIYKN